MSFKDFLNEASIVQRRDGKSEIENILSYNKGRVGKKVLDVNGKEI